MNKRIIFYTLGRLIQIFGALLVLPLIVSLIYQESSEFILSYVITAALSILAGFLLTRVKVKDTAFYAKEGFIIVSLSWILVSFIGALPFVFNGDIPSIVDAFFETSSGLTTSGSSALSSTDHMAHSSIFWRSFTHLVGGMGVLVFALAVLPKVDSETVHIMKAEVPGPQFGKLVARLSDSARILYIIYIIFTLITIAGLVILGMPFFDSMIYAFGAAGTGGFSMNDAGVRMYNSNAIEVFLSIAMVVFGVNFNLYFLLLFGYADKFFKSEELKWYLGFVIGATVLIAIQLAVYGQQVGQALVDSLFAVTSVITTTGYGTANFGQWPLFSQLILLLLMFIGGMAGSTAGGLKVSRIAVAVKAAFAEYKRMLHPNRNVSVMMEGEHVNATLLRSISSYIFVYALVFVAALIIISFDANDFLTAFSSVAATLNNIGPGLGEVGPAGSFAFYNPLSKIVLSFVMIIGRLELFPILILFSPKTWTSIS